MRRRVSIGALGIVDKQHVAAAADLLHAVRQARKAAQAVLLQEREVDLESWWSNWPELHRRQFGQPLPEVLLERGRDFDKVVFGISVGSLPLLCPRLLANSAPLVRLAAQYISCKPTISAIALRWSYPQAGGGSGLQGFHRDCDDWRFIKVFVYLTDVDHTAGPHV